MLDEKEKNLSLKVHLIIKDEVKMSIIYILKTINKIQDFYTKDACPSLSCYLPGLFVTLKGLTDSLPRTVHGKSM